MSFVMLERRKEGVYEQVKFFEAHVSHYTEGDNWTNTGTRTYLSLGMSKEKCIQMYLNQGFMEADND